MPKQAAIIDYHTDWKGILEYHLTVMGYPTNPADDFDSVSVKYFNARHRRISQQPRQVLKATGFTCPTNLAPALSDLETRITKGKDLTPYQSTKLLDPLFDDYLLNDWDIHHFHLGTGQHPTAAGFAARTGPVLFARLTPTTAYLIDVLPHGNWANLRFVKTIHDNWPASIQSHRLPGALHSNLKQTESDVKKLRKAGINSLLEVASGVIYHPFGGGYALNGTAVNVRLKIGKSVQVLRGLEKWTRDNIQGYVKGMHRQGLTPANPLTFTLLVDKNSLRIRENTSGIERQVNEPMLSSWLP